MALQSDLDIIISLGQQNYMIISRVQLYQIRFHYIYSRIYDYIEGMTVYRVQINAINTSAIRINKFNYKIMYDTNYHAFKEGVKLESVYLEVFCSKLCMCVLYIFFFFFLILIHFKNNASLG